MASDVSMEIIGSSSTTMSTCTSTSLSRQRKLVRDYLKFGTEPEPREEEIPSRETEGNKHDEQQQKKVESEFNNIDNDVSTVEDKNASSNKESYSRGYLAADEFSSIDLFEQHPSRVLQQKHARRRSGRLRYPDWGGLGGTTRSWALRLLPAIGLGICSGRAVLPPVPTSLVRLDNPQKLWPASIQFDCLRHGYHLLRVLGTGARARVYLAHRRRTDDLMPSAAVDASDGSAAEQGRDITIDNPASVEAAGAVEATSDQPITGHTGVKRAVKKNKLKYFAIKCVDMPEGCVEQAAAEMRGQVWAHHQVNNHQHVAKLYQYFEGKGRGYYVHEYCRRGSLKQLLRACSLAQQSVLPEDEARHMLTQICTVLRYCHQRQLVHRTLRLHSVLLDDSYSVKLGNWVPANSCKVRFYCDDILDEDVFCAPEMRSRVCACTKKANMWSVGVILYVMLVGRLPYDVTSVHCQDNQRMQRVIFPNNVNKDARLLIRCLLQWRSQRRPSAHDVLQHPWVTGHKVDWPDLLYFGRDEWSQEKAGMLKPAELRLPFYPSCDVKKCMAFTFHSSAESIALKSRVKTTRDTDLHLTPFGGEEYDDLDENCLDMVTDINSISRTCMDQLENHRDIKLSVEMSEVKAEMCPFCQIKPCSSKPTKHSTSKLCSPYFFLPLCENSSSFIPNAAKCSLQKPEADKLDTILARLTGRPPKSKVADKMPNKESHRTIHPKKKKVCPEEKLFYERSAQNSCSKKTCYRPRGYNNSSSTTQDLLSSAYIALTRGSSRLPHDTSDKILRGTKLSPSTCSPNGIAAVKAAKSTSCNNTTQLEQVAPPASVVTSGVDVKRLDCLPPSVQAYLTKTSFIGNIGRNQDPVKDVQAITSSEKEVEASALTARSLPTIVIPITTSRSLRGAVSETGA